MRRTLGLLAALTALAGATACGTTANLGRAGLGTSNGAGALSAPAGGIGTAQGQDHGGSGQGTGAGGASGTTSTAVTDGGGPGGATGGDTSGSVPAGAPGAATPGHIQVGILYSLPAGAGFAAIGASGLNNGDEKGMAQIVVNDANAHGGLGGRIIDPIYYGINANPGGQPIPTQEQEACATFAQDHHVSLMFGDTEPGPLMTCMKSHSIPIIEEGTNGGFLASTFVANPMVFALGMFNLDRRAKVQVAELVQEKYFSGWNTTTGAAGPLPTKVAILTYDQPDFAASAENSLASAIAAAGYGHPSVTKIAYHDSYGQLSDDQTQVASAILQFKAQGITHLFIWDDNGIATLFFMEQAQSQGYHPRYAINTGNNMRLLTEKNLVSTQQVHGAIGIGWFPSFDSKAQAPVNSPMSNPPRVACDKLMQAHGGTVGGETLPTAMAYCAEMTAVKRVFDGDPTATTADVEKAIAAFGSTFVNTETAATYLSATRRDGLSGYFPYGYKESCSCMDYLGPMVSDAP